MRRAMASRPCLRTMSFMTRRRSSTSRPRRRFRRCAPGDISLPHAGNETRKLPRKIVFHELRSDCSENASPGPEPDQVDGPAHETGSPRHALSPSRRTRGTIARAATGSATPYRIVVIQRDRIFNHHVLHGSADVVDVFLKSELRCVHADHDQSLILVFPGPGADVGKSA